MHMKTDSRTHLCPVCGLRYPTRKLAQACKSWCEKHHSCNLDIIKHAVDPDAQKPHDHPRV